MANDGFKLRDLIARIILKADRGSAQKAEQETKQALGGIGETAKKVGAWIAAAFSVGVILRFAQASISAAIDSEREWKRLAGAMASVGAEYDKNERRIKAAARALREMAGVGDEEFAAALNRLTRETGDFNTSLSQMGLVADVAARFFGGDLGSAVAVVSDLMNGMTRSARQLGIVTTDVNEALRILRERSEGAAQNELATLDGRLQQLRDSAGEVREELGFLIFRTFGGSDTQTSVNRFRMGLDAIADRLSRIKGLRFNGFFFVPTFRDKEAPTAAGGTLDDTATLDPIVAIGQRTSPEDRARIAAEQAAERNRLMAARAAGRARDANREADIAASSGIGGNRMGGAHAPILEILEIPDSPTGKQFESDWASMWDRIGGVTTNAFHGIAGAFQDTFTLLLSGAATIGSTFEELGRGIAGALIGGIAEYASVESGKEVAAGVGKLAAGTWPPNPAAIAAAGMHFKSAGLWAVLAGFAGAAQGAIAGGSRGGTSGGVPSGAVDIGGRLAERTNTRAQTIIYIDGFNPKNGEHVRVFRDGMKAAAATDSSIEVRPRKAG